MIFLWDDPHFETAALTAYNAAQSKRTKGQASASATGGKAAAAATELLRSYNAVDERIAQEEARIEEAIDTEDKKKLAALLLPGALPNYQTYKPEKLKV